MSMVAHVHPFVIGIDTHARNHVLAVLTASGEAVDTAQFPTTIAGMARAISWAGRRTGGDLAALWVIEGVASYGAGLAAALGRAGYTVVEAARMNARANRGLGKSDSLNAHRIAAAVLLLDTARLRQPRLAEGARSALQVLIAARDHMTAERTATVNALIALVRVVDLGIDARRPLTRVQIATVARWRSRHEDLGTATARTEVIRLAQRVAELDEQIASNRARMDELVRASQAAPLLEKTGIGTMTAAICLTAWSHHGRVRSEAAFASLGGVNPIPASSGNTIRHRLNSGGERRLNRALHIAVLTRMTHHPETRAYVEKRKIEGRTTKEIRRCRKRYLAPDLPDTQLPRDTTQRRLTNIEGSLRLNAIDGSLGPRVPVPDKSDDQPSADKEAR